MGGLRNADVTYTASGGEGQQHGAVGHHYRAKVAADGGQITNYTDQYIRDLDPASQDDLIRRVNSLKSNLIPN